MGDSIYEVTILSISKNCLDFNSSLLHPAYQTLHIGVSMVDISIVETNQNFHMKDFVSICKEIKIKKYDIHQCSDIK